MKTKLDRILSSFVTTIVLLLVYAVILAVATFIEKYHGTAAAKAMVYYSPLFILLQFLLIVNFVAALIRHRLLQSRKWGLLITHFAFIVILAGALVSFLFGEEGMLHLREGETSGAIAVSTPDGRTTIHPLPFEVELVQFTLTRYPGSASPSAYESEVLVHVDGTTRRERIFMNNVLDVKGYRFFQASYDPDERGTVLSVNRDVAGRNITYAGYLLLLIGFVCCFTGKNSRFRTLSGRLKELRSAAGAAASCLIVTALSFLMPAGAVAQTDAVPMRVTPTDVTAVNASPTDAARAVSESSASADAALRAAMSAASLSEAVQRYAVDPHHAARFGELPIQSGKGRMLPVNTFSSELLRKLHKADRLGALNSDQFLVSLLAMPEMWIRVPMIALPSNELAVYYELTPGQCAYLEVFDAEGRYKLQEKLEEAYNKMPSERSRFDKDLVKLDEQINIFHQLINFQLLNLFPKADDPNHKWYAAGDDLSVFSGKDSMFVSHIMAWYADEVKAALQSGDWTKADEIVGMIHTYQQAKNKSLDIHPEKIRAEIKYNKLAVFRQCKKGYLILGGLLLVISFVALFRPSRALRIAQGIVALGVAAVFCFHSYGMGMRWYIGGYAPWSNSYETMVYVAWATVSAGLLFVRRSMLTFALATLFGGIILFVSGLNWMDPEIGTLVPVLKSPWLMFHVAVIVAAYGFFGICCLIGLTNLVMLGLAGGENAPLLSVRAQELTIINEMALLVGLALMTIGTFLGAVWANESWGRYWGWDPKETWALITLVIYAVVAHLRLVPKWKSSWLFNFASVLAFASVLMTFFGVNYFLSGMHSYGQNNNVQGIFIYLYAAVGVVCLLGVWSYIRYKKNIEKIV